MVAWGFIRVVPRSGAIRIYPRRRNFYINVVFSLRGLMSVIVAFKVGDMTEAGVI
jgi:hypothetical protein